MLLKLIKTREMISGAHCEVWEVNSGASFQRNGRSGLRLERPNCENGRLLAEVFVLNEHLPLELIYRLTVSWRGICIQGKYCAWQWNNCVVERMVTEYLTAIQRSREEIRIEICRPIPDLPGYPEVEYHPDDYPIVLLDDLDENERPEEPVYVPDYA